MTSRAARRVGLLGLGLMTACGPSSRRLPAGHDSRLDHRTTVFGTQLIELAFSFDGAARQSLIAAPETGVPARMTFTDEHGTSLTDDVRLHIKGQRGSSRPLDDKPAFKVDLGKHSRFFGLEHLTLNNMVQDDTMLHEAIGYPVYEAAGVAVPATGYARLTVNGLDYGLYLNLETPDTRFLQHRFGDDRGILYEGSYGVDLRESDVDKFELHEGVDPGRAKLRDLVRAIGAPGDGIFYGAAARVDTASFVGMMAAAALLGDWDNYYSSNNFRMYWTPQSDRWHFIPTGIDETFASSIGVFEATGVLFQKCLASERCTTDYATAVRAVAGRFTRLDLPARMDALAAVIDTAAEADPRKKPGAETMASARAQMRAFIARRPAEAIAALSCLDGGREARAGACAGAVAVNMATGQCLDAGAEGTGNGDTVGASDCRGTFNQHWHLVARGAGGVALAAMRGGTCLEVDGGPTHEGAPARQAGCSRFPALARLLRRNEQVFRLRPSPAGTQIVSAESGRCLAAAPAGSNGGAVVQVTCADDPAQKWRVQWSMYQ